MYDIDWDYARLSHEAAVAGGPEAYKESLYDEGYYDGVRQYGDPEDPYELVDYDYIVSQIEDDKLEDAFNEGFFEGEDVGYDEGFEKGCYEGFDEGYAEGTSDERAKMLLLGGCLVIIWGTVKIGKKIYYKIKRRKLEKEFELDDDEPESKLRKIDPKSKLRKKDED